MIATSYWREISCALPLSLFRPKPTDTSIPQIFTILKDFGNILQKIKTMRCTSV
jgi:hypothetical protein